MAVVGFRVTGSSEVVHDLTRFRQNVTRARPALEGMAEHVAGMQRDQFETEGRHYGPGWASLSPRYKAWKMRRRPGRKILVLNGDLRAAAAPSSARGFDIYRVTDRAVTVGVSYTQTPHARWHQEGTARMPARTVMGTPTRGDQKALTKILHEHLVKGVAGARR